MKWETVIGLEVHAELSTKSKIFCACANAHGGEPNTRVCPVCLGLPGALPKLNRAAVECALRVGLALGCSIARRCGFDRKNYFYPDLPKGYQITQMHEPICRGGSIEIEIDGAKKAIGISQIHMEEDSGKLIHDPRGSGTLIDLNRSGVPLLEIVSLPDAKSAGEAVAYLERLRETLLYLGVCDCKMQEGSFRADVNISVRPNAARIEGGQMGERVEIKNLNSFKAVRRAIEAEAARQIEALESGGHVARETRRWDDEKGLSTAMRSKEADGDYRAFPEPDLPPAHIDDAWIAAATESLPELAHQKRERFVRAYGLCERDAAALTARRNVCALFEALAERSGEPIESARLVIGEIMRLMNESGAQEEDPLPDAGKLSTLIGLLLSAKINRRAYKETVEAVFMRGADPETHIAENSLEMSRDDEAASQAASAALSENPEAARQYHEGKTKALDFLMGQTMKKLGGTGNPATARKALEDALAASVQT